MLRRQRTGALRRSGCATCKYRHKKCDERKPRCGHCTRLGLECKPVELFRASKPMLLNVNKSWPHSLPLEQRPDPVTGDPVTGDPVTGDPVTGDPESYEIENPPENRHDNAIGCITRTNRPLLSPVHLPPSPWSTICTEPQATSMEHYLLHHYTFHMSRVLVNVDGPSNPLRSVLLPRAVSSPILMDALYAASALHAYVGNRDPEFRLTSLKYYNKAASALQGLIADLENQESGPGLEILLLTSVYLCKYEIISGAVSNWRTHLHGLQQMFRIFQRNRSLISPETVAYIKSFIAYHSRIAGLTNYEKSTSSINSCNEQDDESTQDSNYDIDPYMGVSAGVIALLHTAAEAIALDPTKPSDLDFMMKTVIKIYQKSKSDENTIPTVRQLDGLSLETITCLDHIFSAYRNALVTYLHTILDAIESNTTADELLLQSLGMRSLLLSTKADAVSACLQDMLCVPDDESCSVGLVPLLFVVASETTNRTEFEMASQRLQAILNTACLGNIAPTLELLQKIQQTNPKDWRQTLKGFEWDLIVT